MRRYLCSFILIELTLFRHLEKYTKANSKILNVLQNFLGIKRLDK